MQPCSDTPPEPPTDIQFFARLGPGSRHANAPPETVPAGRQTTEQDQPRVLVNGVVDTCWVDLLGGAVEAGGVEVVGGEQLGESPEAAGVQRPQHCPPGLGRRPGGKASSPVGAPPDPTVGDNIFFEYIVAIF